jgi:Flp pilus assembly protein TadD
LLAAHARPGFPAGLFHVWRAVQAWPDHPAVIERRREYLESLRLALKGELLKADDALGALDSMGPAAAEFGLGLLARAWALQRKGRLDEALSAATRAAELCPNCPEAHATLAAILTRLGQSERAQVHQRHAERLFAEQRMTD